MAWVGATGVVNPEGPVPADSLVIHTVDPPGDSAAVLVPDPSASGAKVNRIPLPPGLHLVHHGDCLEVGGRRFWVELRRMAEESRFDPEVHGADLFCAATRARLNTGDPIVTCPGNQEGTCELVYSLVAWRASATCHGCGASHDPEPWAPPVEPKGSSLAELLESGGGGEGS